LKLADEQSPRAENTRNLVEELYFGTAENTVAESAKHSDSYIKPYNPDDLWQKSGDYSIYEDMRKDDQVHVGIQLKKDLVIGSGWDIVSDDEGQEDIAKDIYARLNEDPDIAIDEHIDELLDTAYTFGFSLSEKIFKLREDQSLTFNELKTRHPDTWTIHTDVKGNVSKYEQHGSSGDLDIEGTSLIHYKINPMHQNPYGRSDLRPAYAAWFTKRHIIRFYSIFLEKHASPIPYAKYDNNIPQTKINELYNIIKSFQTKTAMVIPKAFEVDFLQSSSNGEAYIKGINLFNMIIGRSLLMPDLIGLSGSETSGGSFSLGKEQMEIFFKHIRRRRAALERLINRHIVQPLVVWNYGNVENYPKFKLNPISDADSMEYARTFIEAMKGSLYKPNDEEINHFRSLIKFPEGEVQEKEQPQQSPFFQSPMPQGEGMDEPEIDDNQEIKDDIEDEKKEELKADDKKDYATVYNKDKIKFDGRVDYQAIQKQLDSTENKIVNESKPIIDEIFEDLINQIQKKKILNTPPKPERVNDIKLKKLSSLQKVFKKQLRQHFQDSKSMARAELFKAKFTVPLPSDAFLAFLENETFQYIGDWEYAITKSMRVLLNNAIKEGRPLSAVIAELENTIKPDSIVNIERYSRTKTTEVLNRARVEEFTDSGAVHGFEYSAIMDSRTSTICRGLHGKTFQRGNEPIPPMHFNCRSVLVPITIFEEFEPDKKVGSTEINTFIEDNKGKGFSTR
jgi:SPP1 gp7 family putative phage head morphogenesis protein